MRIGGEVWLHEVVMCVW